MCYNKIIRIYLERLSMPLYQETQQEKRLIQTLISGESQWSYRPDLKTPDELWDNFFNKLEQNNLARLDGVPLT